MKKRVLPLLIIVLLTTLCMAVSVSAAEVASGTCGENLTWTLNDEGTLTISGSGEMDDEDWEATRCMADGHGWHDIQLPPWFDYRADIQTVVLPEGLTSIGQCAFRSCQTLTTINLPDSLRSIGTEAFAFCPRLSLPELPGGLASIGSHAFSQCGRITSIAIPVGITEIPDYLFQGCSNLKTINLPEGITAIGAHAFDSCSKLTSIDLPDSLESIGVRAFYGCENLVSIDFPDNLKSIGEAAFNTCKKLSSVDLPDSVESIGDFAFMHCWALTSVDLPDNLKSISTQLFYSCGNLTSVDLPDHLESIGNLAFHECTRLTSIDLPGSVESIGAQAFYNCDALAYAVIPDGVTEIEGYTFYSCSALTSVTIPDSVTYIGNNAFRYCTTLTDIYFCGTEAEWEALVPADLADSIFDGHADITVHYNAIGFTRQPRDITAADGTKAKFSVETVGDGVTYKWQYKTATGTKWNNLSAAKSSTTVTATEKKDGYQYRCIITKGDYTFTSEPATLTVEPVIITSQPQNTLTPVGKKVTFSVEAEGTDLTYQWQYKAPGATSWKYTTFSGAKTDTITVTPKASHDGYQFLCRVTNGAGEKVYSKSATLTVTSFIVSQPKDKTVAPGVKAKFSVEAVGTDVTYQWQYKTPSGTSWKNTTFSGCTTDTLIVTPKDSHNGYQYRCKVTRDGVTAYSNAAKLTVKEIPTATVTAQPVSVSTTPSGTATFTVTADGTDITYLWQYKTPGGEWEDTACTAKSLSVSEPGTEKDGYRYRCLVSNGGGTVVTDAATLTVATAIDLSGHPGDKTVAAGDNASFSVSAYGTGLSYQWQSKAPGGSWTDEASTSGTFSISSVSAELDGYRYRCIITDSEGSIAISTPAALTVE